MPDAACPSVPTESLPPTTVPASFLNCSYMVQFQSQGMCLLCQAFPAGKVPVNPTRASARLAHRCTDQHFQFCFPQKRSDSGDVTDASLAGSRRCGCSQAPAAGVSLKPTKGMPAWQSSICPPLAPQSDLVAFQPFSFLLSIVALASVLYVRPQWTKVIPSETQPASVNSNYCGPLCKCVFWQVPGPSCGGTTHALETTMPVPSTLCRWPYPFFFLIFSFHSN